jgi:hypothetical protein
MIFLKATKRIISVALFYKPTGMTNMPEKTPVGSGVFLSSPARYKERVVRDFLQKQF